MKKILLFLAMGAAIVGLAGCGSKAIPSKEAAELFINQLIYQKEPEKFSENFDNGEELTKTFEKNATAFRDTFAAGLVAAETPVTQQTATEISKLLMEKVKSDTNYQVKVAEGEGIRNVSYQINGLDLVAVMKQTTQLVTSAMLADTSLAKDDQRLQEETLKELKHVLTAPPVKSEAVTVMLEMKPVKGKWQIVAGQKNQLEDLYLAFVSGVKDQETLISDWDKAQTELTKELEDKLR